MVRVLALNPYNSTINKQSNNSKARSLPDLLSPAGFFFVWNIYLEEINLLSDFNIKGECTVVKITDYIIAALDFLLKDLLR